MAPAPAPIKLAAVPEPPEPPAAPVAPAEPPVDPWAGVLPDKLPGEAKRSAEAPEEPLEEWPGGDDDDEQEEPSELPAAESTGAEKRKMARRAQIQRRH